jgi:hypothetical protein
MIARAGALDQGNIGLNLADSEKRGLSENILFLAGSAINSIKNEQGKADPNVGAEAMSQAIEIHQSGQMAGVSIDEHLKVLMTIAMSRNFKELQQALQQRYPEFGGGH